jgi:succinate-acetate transporter protein
MSGDLKDELAVSAFIVHGGGTQTLAVLLAVRKGQMAAMSNPGSYWRLRDSAGHTR